MRALSLVAVLTIASAASARAQDGLPPPPAVAPIGPQTATQAAASVASARSRVDAANGYLERYGKPFETSNEAYACAHSFSVAIGDAKTLGLAVRDPAEQAQTRRDANLLVLRGVFARALVHTFYGEPAWYQLVSVDYYRELFDGTDLTAEQQRKLDEAVAEVRRFNDLSEIPDARIEEDAANMLVVALRVEIPQVRAALDALSDPALEPYARFLRAKFGARLGALQKAKIKAVRYVPVWVFSRTVDVDISLADIDRSSPTSGLTGTLPR
jgi:hypothetical protein